MDKWQLLFLLIKKKKKKIHEEKSFSSALGLRLKKDFGTMVFQIDSFVLIFSPSTAVRLFIAIAEFVEQLRANKLRPSTYFFNSTFFTGTHFVFPSNSIFFFLCFFFALWISWCCLIILFSHVWFLRFCDKKIKNKNHHFNFFFFFF